MGVMEKLDIVVPTGDQWWYTLWYSTGTPEQLVVAAMSCQQSYSCKGSKERKVTAVKWYFTFPDISTDLLYFQDLL